MCGAAFAGCGNNADSSKAESKAESSSSQVEKMPETDEEWTQAMYDKAMVSYGNTSMMQNVIKKAQSGEKVTVAYLGGSITEGISAGADGCYAKLTYDYFAQKFGTGDNVQYVNAGLSGTPSKLGILRLDRDVLAYEPDICFIEFAVNDGTETDYQNAYESIVRTLLQKNITPVLLFSVTENDHSAQDYMKQIGEFYHLPMISYCDALRYLFANNRMTWKDFPMTSRTLTMRVTSLWLQWWTTILTLLWTLRQRAIMLCPQTLFSLHERWTLICMRATALRQQVLEVGRKALLSQALQMAGLTTTLEITALSYSSSRTKNSCT